MKGPFLSLMCLELWLLCGRLKPSAADNSTSEDDAEDSRPRGDDVVHVLNAPTTIVHNMRMTLEYQCTRPRVIGAGIHVWTEAQDRVQIFITTWRCKPKKIPGLSKKVLHIKLPRYFAYRPGYLNKYSVYTTLNNFVAWILDPVVYTEHRHKRTWFDASKLNLAYRVYFLEPFDRPVRPVTRCLDWWQSIKSNMLYEPTCSWQPGKGRNTDSERVNSVIMQ